MTVYTPKTEEGALERLKEECAEVIKEACKITRNRVEGYQQSPEYTYLYGTPVERLLKELGDLKRAIAVVEYTLHQELDRECDVRLSPCGKYHIHKADCAWAIKYGAIREDNLPNMVEVEALRNKRP